jgi:C-terminal processing protease CtpA/Prc
MSNPIVRYVELTKDDKGYGFTLVSCYTHVISVIHNRPAEGKLLENEHIISINGESMETISHGEIVKLLQTETNVTLGLSN